MAQNYDGLRELLSQDQKANEIFLSLPAYVREQISQRDSAVHNVQELEDYADNLLKGDC